MPSSAPDGGVSLLKNNQMDQESSSENITLTHDSTSISKNLIKQPMSLALIKLPKDSQYNSFRNIETEYISVSKFSSTSKTFVETDISSSNNSSSNNDNNNNNNSNNNNNNNNNNNSGSNSIGLTTSSRLLSK